ncbi:MAG: hypothetical protein V7K69_31730 [Nostoc sp.]
MSQLAKAENPNNPILNDSTRGNGQGEKEQEEMIPAPCCGASPTTTKCGSSSIGSNSHLNYLPCSLPPASSSTPLGTAKF